MSSRVAAVLVAGGEGQRLGHGEPKAFVPLAGRPLLLHAARTLLSCAAIGHLIVVVGEGHVARAQALLEEAGTPAAVRAGGATRRASVAAGLAALPPETEIVAVHDAARPLVSAGLVTRTLTALTLPWSAVGPALPVSDTLKLADPHGRQVLRTVDRRDLWAVQTPQVFPREVLERAHAHATGEETDDLGLVEAVGGRVRLVDGEPRNFKVTYPDDLALAEVLACAAAGRDAR